MSLNKRTSNQVNNTKNITNEEKSFMSMAANFHNPQSQDMENVIIKLSEINFWPYI